MLRLFLAILGCLLATACSHNSGPRTDLPRVAPGYLHWLEKESMLNQAPALIAQVSQTSRVWFNNSETMRAHVMLAAAPNWLQAPVSYTQPLFQLLSSHLPQIKSMGFQGVYLGLTGEDADIWLKAQGTSKSGTEPASLGFDSAMGNGEDFNNLAQKAEAVDLQLGSSLLPAATGRGPDFLLQARNAPGHSGLYAMLPVPPENLSILPPAADEWDCKPVDSRAVEQLAEAGVVPSGMARDAWAWASPGGWAATGKVGGADGAQRRWLYRYANSIQQPVLLWQDPSGQAERVFAAAVIQHTGLQGQTLAGLHLEPLMGLEPEPESTQPLSLSPGLEALNSISRQIHRYGGWALQADPVPLPVLEAVLAGQCDFCRDDLTFLLALFGFMEADGRPMAQLYRRWIEKGIQCNRLAHGFNSMWPVNPRLALDLPNGENIAKKLASIMQDYSAKMEAQSSDSAFSLFHFLLTWRLGTPGVAFMSQEEMENMEKAGASAGRAGYTREIRNLLQARHDSGLATGKPVSVTRGKGGGFGLLTSLPNGDYWLLACNFGRNSDELQISLPSKMTRAQNPATGENLSANFQSGSPNFRLSLDGRQAGNVLFTSN